MWVGTEAFLLELVKWSLYVFNTAWLQQASVLITFSRQDDVEFV